MKESKSFKSFLAALVIVALSAPAITSAGDRNEMQGASVKVTYASLIVEKDAQSLYRRLKQASAEVCDYNRLSNAGSAKRMAELRQCYKEALSTAVRQVNNELVTDIHES